MQKGIHSVVRLTLAFVILCGVSGCNKDSHETVTVEYIDVMQQLIGLCDKMTDKETALQSRERLQALLDQLKKLKNRADSLGEADPSIQKRLQKKYDQQLNDLAEKYSKSFHELEKRKEVVKALEPELKTLAKLLGARPIRIR